MPTAGSTTSSALRERFSAILLRWGATPLNAITALGVNKWISDLRQLGYANTTVAKVLSMILTDAADEHLIPIRRYRRQGRRGHRIQQEKGWATPTEVLRITEQAAALSGDTASLLIITAAWTGSLHESAHSRWLGAPKTPSSARTIMLPPFLISHKTWLIAGGAPEVELRLLNDLQRRWHEADLNVKHTRTHQNQQSATSRDRLRRNESR